MTFRRRRRSTWALNVRGAAVVLSLAVGTAGADVGPTPAPAPAAGVIPPSVWDGPMVDFGWQGVDVPAPTPLNETSPRTVELLGDALGRARGTRRASLLAEIGRCKLPQSVPYVRAAFPDPDALVRLEALRAAGLIADPSLRPDVSPLLGDPDPLVRREALVAAHAIDTAAADASGGSGRSAAVSAALADPSAPAVVLVAALRRAAPADAAAVAALLPRLAPALQPEAARALGRLRATAHAGAVAPLLGSADAAGRAAGAAVLGELGATDRLGAVVELLADPHPTVRREALTAVGRLAPVGARQERAIAALGDPDASVRTAAAQVLARHPKIDAVPALLDLLSDPLPTVHDAARDALASPASAAMRDLVSDRAAAMLDEPESHRRIDGSYLLGRLRSDKNAARHVSFLEIGQPLADNDLPLITQAAESAGRIGLVAARPHLAELARRAPSTVMGGDPKQFLSFDAIVAVFVAGAKLGEPGVLPEARRVLGAGLRHPSEVQGATIFAIAALTDPADPAANKALLDLAMNEGGAWAARYEAIKALVRRRAPGILGPLEGLAATSADPYARFAAHWAVEQLGGARRPYVPPTRPWSAATSLVDLAEGG